MKVQGFTTVSNRIEGTITQAELVALVRKHLAIPATAELRFLLLNSSGRLIADVGDEPDAYPLLFRATWEQAVTGKPAELPPAASEVTRAAGGGPAMAVVDVMYDPPLPTE